MPVPSSLASLSQTPGSNSPAGSDTVFPSLDDYLREIFADLARLRDGAQHILTSVAGTDTITASCAQISTFAAGQMFAFVSAGANTTTTVTLNINSLGAKSILRPGGGAMAVGDIPASGVVFVGYNGTNFEHLNSRHASTADSATSNAVDAAYFMALLTGNPLLQFDTNDYIWYDRTNNKMGFSVGGTDRMTIDATDGPQRPNDASTGNGLVRKSQIRVGIASLSVSVAANAMTGTLAAEALDFRSTTLTIGTPVERTAPASASLTVPSGATLGTVNGVASRIVWGWLDNAGTLEPFVSNLAGGMNLDETKLISTTAISASANSAGVAYSQTARTNVAFRVRGFCDITEVTAGTWAAAPTLVQGAGGQALAAMSSLGYGQTVQDVSASRAAGVTYYNVTSKPIMVIVSGSLANGSTTAAVVDGVALPVAFNSTSGATPVTFIVPIGSSYSCTFGSGSLAAWIEFR